jgi:lactate dehydrogenase-like 2-hydroxyacid dehydrogenase
MLKLLVTRKQTEDAEKIISKACTASLNASDTPLSANSLVTAAQGMDAIMCTSMDKFSSDLIRSLPATVKLIATVSAGHEHIDLAATKARGIAVTNTPDVLTDATADVTMLLILGAARGDAYGDRMVRNKEWPPAAMTANLWHDVSGRKLGILGMGRIGQAVAKRARGFDMEIHYHNRKPLPANEAHSAVYHPTLEDLLPHCEFLAINCALTPETKGIINAKALAMMPNGSIVVNAARGGVVDDDALIAALKSGHIAAAGLDVFNNEPNIDARYRDLPTAFLLPHIGSATTRTRTAMAVRALSNVEDFFAGRKPRDLLT